MLTCNLMGGLGNQLFQIFTVISYAINTNNQFKFLNVDTLGEGSTTRRHTYWNSFLSRLKPFLIDDLPQPIRIIREKHFNYEDISSQLINKNEDIIIYGYFQSYKYFQNNYQLICRVIGLKNIKENVKNMSLDINFERSVSIHFRIGDYKPLHNVYPIMDIDYYRNCIKYTLEIDSNINNILYFCEDHDYECIIQLIDQLRDEFTNLTFTRANVDLDDWQQMALMSFCHHNIIANSTFSWWGAYFNDWDDKIVCYPSKWFVKNIDTDDLCPNNWVKI